MKEQHHLTPLTKAAIETIAVELMTSNVRNKVEKAQARNAGDGWTIQLENHTGGYTQYENVTVSAENFDRAKRLVDAWCKGRHIEADDPSLNTEWHDYE